MRKDASDGKENISQQDIIIPRIALMQSVSDEVTEGLASAGNFFHTILEEEFGDLIDDLVIIHHRKVYNLWQPRHMGGGILARATDGENWDPQFRGMEFEVAPYKDQPRKKVKWSIGTSPAEYAVNRDTGLGAWGSMDPDNSDSQPAATLSHQLLCVSLSRLSIGPFVVLLQRTGEKVARGLLGKVKVDPAPIYGQVYKMSSKTQSSPSGDYFNYAFSKNGHVPDEGLYLQLQEMHRKYAELNYNTNADKDDDLPAGGDGGDGGASDKDAKY